MLKCLTENGFISKYLCSLEKAYLDLAMPVTLENSLIESEVMSLATKISRLLCIDVIQRFPFGCMAMMTLAGWLGYCRDISAKFNGYQSW